MVIELRFFKKKNNNHNNKKKMKNMGKNVNSTFLILRISYITDQPIFFNLDTIKSGINFKLKVKMKNILIYGFQWG